MSKEYGLIIPGQHKIQAPVRRAAVFDEDSDSDESNNKPTFSRPLEKKQVKITQTKTIEEDPTVYQYDEIYDEMEKKRNESKLSRKDLDKKPKYIKNLLKAAEFRKRENERRIERQVQKEREAEGDEFKDKESYVTPSYLKKLEEMKELEEKEKREEYLESIGDVRKQGNLDGFYRHLYDQKVNYEDSIKKEVDEEVETSSTQKRKSSSEDEKDSSINNDKIKKKAKNRHYRSRNDPINEEEEKVEVKKEHMPSNLDADSDFSIDSSDSETEDVKKSESDKKEEKLPNKNNEIQEIKQETDTSDRASDQKDSEKGEKEKKEDEIETKIEPEIEKKPKIDIWKKRTVGQVFEDARKRYFERLSLRNSG